MQPAHREVIIVAMNVGVCREAVGSHRLGIRDDALKQRGPGVGI